MRIAPASFLTDATHGPMVTSKYVVRQFLIVDRALKLPAKSSLPLLVLLLREPSPLPFSTILHDGVDRHLAVRNSGHSPVLLPVFHLAFHSIYIPTGHNTMVRW